MAYLEQANEQFWAWLDGAGAGLDDPRARLVATFDAVAKLADSPQCLGCTFPGAAAEFPDPEHPGHRGGTSPRPALAWRPGRGRRPPPPADLAQQLLLLMDGAWVAARMFGPDNPAVQVAAAARALIEAH